MIKNQFGVNIKRRKCDNGKEYFNHILISFCQKEGIVHKSSCVKRPNLRTIVSSKCSQKFMREVVLTNTYLINRLPSMDALSNYLSFQRF